MTYPVILADPPWDFGKWNKETSNRSEHYQRMSIDTLCALPVGDLASDNAALFMWVVDWTTPYDSQRVMESWGFTYRTRAWTWVKLNSNSMGTFVGMGYYTRSNTEDCWLGVRGRMPVLAHDVQALIMSPVQEHSRKPDDQYRKIERLYDGPYLELFARRKRAGWDAWGNEVESDVVLPLFGAVG